VHASVRERASAVLLRSRSGYGSTRRCTGYRGDPTWNALTQYLCTSVRQLRRDQRAAARLHFAETAVAPWKNEPDPRSMPRARPVSRDSYCISPLSSVPPSPPRPSDCRCGAASTIARPTVSASMIYDRIPATNA